MKKIKEIFNGRRFRSGGYSFVLILVVLALLVAVNVMFASLPSTITQLDMSSTRLYSVTSQTKVVLNGLAQDVKIYWIVQAGEEDTVLDKLLAKYDDLSEYVSFEKIDPDEYPTFAAQYTDTTVTNNDLLVINADESVYRYIANADIYVTSYDTSTYTTSTEFDGEGSITSAIAYVVSDDLPVAYFLTGHGEEDLTDDAASAFDRENIVTAQLSLLTEDEIPEDCNVIIINAPDNDISEAEAEILGAYLESGGKLLMLSGPVPEAELTNLWGVLGAYGISAEEGIAVDLDREHYAFSAPYILLPDIASDDITDPLIDEGYYAIVPIAAGLSVDDTVSDATVTELLTTSESSFVKIAGYALTTYEKEEDDIDGPFAVGIAVEKEIDDETTMQAVWFSTSYLLDEIYNAYSANANMDLVLNAVTWMCGESEAVSIRPKAMGIQYLTISAATASSLKVIMIGIIPLAILAIGIFVVIQRRRLT